MSIEWDYIDQLYREWQKSQMEQEQAYAADAEGRELNRRILHAGCSVPCSPSCTAGWNGGRNGSAPPNPEPPRKSPFGYSGGWLSQEIWAKMIPVPDAELRCVLLGGPSNGLGFPISTSGFKNGIPQPARHTIDVVVRGPKPGLDALKISPDEYGPDIQTTPYVLLGSPTWDPVLACWVVQYEHLDRANERRRLREEADRLREYAAESEARQSDFEPPL